jgi:hypothetical protein
MKTGAKPKNGKPHADDVEPMNEEAEFGLLSSLWSRPDFIDHPEVVCVQPQHFWDPTFRAIHRHIVGAHLDGKELETLPARMMAAGEYDEGMRSILFRLASPENRISGSDAAYFAGLVIETAQRRKLWTLARELYQQVESRLPIQDVEGFLAAYVEGGGAPTSGERFKMLTAAELDDTSDEIPYVVGNVLAEGQPCLCLGGSKMLKTTVLVDLVLSSCWQADEAGRHQPHFLGYFPVHRQCRSWFISGESGDATIKESCRRIARAAGREFRETQGWFYTPTLPRLANPADMSELGRKIKGEGIGILVIDPAYLCMDVGGRESSVFAMGSQLARVAEVCSKHRCTPIIAHHTTQQRAKAKDFTPPALHDASWAGFEQFARQWILLNRREAYQDGSAPRTQRFY